MDLSIMPLQAKPGLCSAFRPAKPLARHGFLASGRVPRVPPLRASPGPRTGPREGYSHSTKDAPASFWPEQSPKNKLVVISSISHPPHPSRFGSFSVRPGRFLIRTTNLPKQRKGNNATVPGPLFPPSIVFARTTRLDQETNGERKKAAVSSICSNLFLLNPAACSSKCFDRTGKCALPHEDAPTAVRSTPLRDKDILLRPLKQQGSRRRILQSTSTCTGYETHSLSKDTPATHATRSAGSGE